MLKPPSYKNFPRFVVPPLCDYAWVLYDRCIVIFFVARTLKDLALLTIPHFFFFISDDADGQNSIFRLKIVS